VNTHAKAVFDAPLKFDRTFDPAIPQIETKRSKKPGLQTNFEIPSHIDFVAPAVDRVVRRLRKANCVPGQETSVAIALFEAIANAVKHGNKQQASKPVHIGCTFEPKSCVSIVVKDEGEGFDPKAVPDPTLPENLESEHGRGILLMKTVMDEVYYEKGGTEIHLVKRCDRSVPSRFALYAARLRNFFRGEWLRSKWR
jgi:serine/threonine-protein kinase RsbW